MKRLAAYQIGEKLHTLSCTGPFHGRVRSVFSHAANIEFKGSLYVIYEGAGGSARTLSLRECNLASSGLDVGQACLLKGGHLQAGPLAIDFSEARLYVGRLQRDLRQTCEQSIIGHYLHACAQLGSPAGRHPFIDAGLIGQLASPATAAGAVRRLVGLGPGLTPAGDDIICGALAASNHLLADKTLASILGQAVFERVDKTTSLSRQILLDALEGAYHEYLDMLVYALFCGDTSATRDCLTRLLSLGASSGADMAAGIASVLRAVRQGGRPAPTTTPTTAPTTTSPTTTQISRNEVRHLC